MSHKFSAMRRALGWYDNFNRFAGDLYPGRYTMEKCLELANQAEEAEWLARTKGSCLLAHYYTYPEFHEIAHKLGDSLALSLFARQQKVKRVDFQAVFFMGATAKIIIGDNGRVFVPDSPQVLGCSLVLGTDPNWVENWKIQNPDGIIVTYINSDPYIKALSHYICTSRNTAKIIAHAIKNSPGKKILILPDKFLGYVMKFKALELLRAEGISADPDLIEIYQHSFGGYNASCYVHEQLGHDAVDVAMLEHPDAELMIHPECGCASSCLYKLHAGIIPHNKAFFLSTEQMIRHAEASQATEFIVATEPGLLYALRKRIPEKIFIPVSAQAQCQFMKANSFEKLLASLRGDKLEIVICDNCSGCLNPRTPYQDEKVIHISRRIAEKAKIGIERMLAIQ